MALACNVGTTDKTIRLFLAAALILAAFTIATGALAKGLLLVGAAVMLLTAMFGFCPLYRLFGLNTCEGKARLR